MKRVVIAGGGIAGLTTALHLKDRAGSVDGGLEVVVLEATDRPGGNIRTDREEGFTIERGPNGFLDNVPATPALVRRLGLESQIQKADRSAARRFLFRGGRLHLLPSGPVGFLRSPVLSLDGRIQVLKEPFARPAPPDVDETIFDFASRRIGEEAASILIDAMVSGVFAGDVRELSLASSFPKMAAMEAEHGGLVRAMVARMRERRAARRDVKRRRARGEDVENLVRPGGPAGPGGTLTSFRDGLDAFPEALARELGDSVRYGVEVAGVDRDGQGDSPSGIREAWRIRTAYGEVLTAHALLLAVPSPKAFPLLWPLDRELAGTVGMIKTAGLAVAALGFSDPAVAKATRGFGFLVPRGEGPRILGCLWDSSIFPGRAPEGQVLMRVMIGGAHDPEAVSLPDEELIDIVLRDLGGTMGLKAEPLLTRIFRWPLGIGQYTVGHGDRIGRIQSHLGNHPGLWLAGSSYYGISMNACIEKAGEQAEEILTYLNHPLPGPGS